VTLLLLHLAVLGPDVLCCAVLCPAFAVLLQFLPSVTELVVAQCYYLDFDDRWDILLLFGGLGFMLNPHDRQTTMALPPSCWCHVPSIVVYCLHVLELCEIKPWTVSESHLRLALN
jgi:hypothetical protein